MDSLGLWGLFASSFVSSTLLPGGSEVLLGYLLVEQHSPVVLTVVVASLGNTLGGAVTFVMGWLLAVRFPCKPLTQSRHRQLHERLQRFGPVCLLFSWLPVVGDPLCFVAGWMRLTPLLSMSFILVGKTLRYLMIAAAVS